MVRNCFTCKMYVHLGYGKDGVCERMGIPCDGFRCCASHERIPGGKMLKHREDLSDRPSGADKDKVVKSTEEKKRPHSERKIIKSCSPLRGSVEITETVTLFMRKKGSDRMIKVDDFDMLWSIWKIPAEKAVELAEFGGEINGMTFLFRKTRRGIEITHSDGTSAVYSSIVNASKEEGISQTTISRYIDSNRPDTKGRTYAYKWYDEDVPYKTKVCKSTVK